jgi:hypothetical protein
MKNTLLLLFLCGSINGMAQKDTFRLACPLTDAVEVFEKQPYSLGKELKIILSSPSDTTVKVGILGTVTNVQQDEERKWIVVVNYRKFYFWYSGITKVTVREEQKLKAGDVLGYIAPGGKLELHVFDFETPLDPKRYLDCKVTK